MRGLAIIIVALVVLSATVRGQSRFVPRPTEPLPGKNLITLRDAALYITKLPKAEHDTEEWQAAMQALLLVVEHGGPTMFARIGIMRALSRNVVREFDSSQGHALGTEEA